jgi:hypothetical protein
MTKAKPIPLELIKERFRCDFDKGILYWNNPHPNNRRVKSGDPVGLVPHGNGYLRVDLTVDGKVKKYLAHRVIYAMYTNTSMDHNLDIDHIDRDKHNNSIHNLRLATRSQNKQNNNAKGFYWHKATQKWVARAYDNGKQLTLGYFDCPLMARLCYEEAKRSISKEFTPIHI